MALEEETEKCTTLEFDVGGPRSALSNDHKVITNARRSSGRHGQIHAYGSGLPGAQRQLFRFHLAHELMRVRHRQFECAREDACSGL